jgi:DNA-binding response OmpR family regulator
MVESDNPDLVILDLGLPDIHGLEVLKRIRLFSSVIVFILTISEDEPTLVKAFDLGVDEYLVKPFRQMELLARVKAAASKKNMLLSDSYQKMGPFMFNSLTHSIKYNEKTINLTRGEFLLLRCLATNHKRVVAYSTIAESIWGTDYPGSEKAIRVYIRQLRKKIEKDPDNPEIILIEPRLGYVIH